MTTSEVIDIISACVAEETGAPVATVRPGDTFFDLGLDSVTCIFVLERIEQRLGVTLNPIYFWDYPTVETFAGYVLEQITPKP